MKPEWKIKAEKDAKIAKIAKKAALEAIDHEYDVRIVLYPKERPSK